MNYIHFSIRSGKNTIGYEDLVAYAEETGKMIGEEKGRERISKGQNRTEEKRTQVNRREQNRTQENRTEQNRIEHKRTEQNRTGQDRTQENRTQ